MTPASSDPRAAGRRRAWGRLFPGRTALARLGAARRRRLRERLFEWRQTRLLGPVLAIAGGTAAAQALVFAARPVLTRLYTPEAWGVLTLFVTVVTFGSALSSGGYRYAILLPAHDRDAAGVVGLSLMGAVLTGLLSAALVAVGVEAGGLSPLWWWLPPTAVALEVGLTTETWLTRGDRFAPVSASRMGQQLVVVGLHLTAGLAGLASGAAGAAWLVGGTAVGYGAAAVVVGTWMLTRARPAIPWQRTALSALARRFVRFPMYSAPAALLNLASTRLPVFVLAAVAGEAAVGQFGIAFGALALPLGLVTGSVGQVFFVRAAEAARAGTLEPLTRRVAHGLLAATAFPCLAVLVAGPTLFAFVFGDVWATAGEYARVLAPWTLAASVAAPLTVLFDVLERQRADLMFSVLMAAGTTAALVVGGWGGSAYGLILAGSAAGTVLRTAHVAWMLHLARVPLGAALGDTLRVLAVAAPLALGVGLVDRAGWGGPAVLAATALGGVVTLALVARSQQALHA